MRTSNYLLSTLKETPNDAEVVSHQLMLRAGMIRKLASGLYTWLPTGLRVMRKVENIVRQEIDNADVGPGCRSFFIFPVDDEPVGCIYCIITVIQYQKALTTEVVCCCRSTITVANRSTGRSWTRSGGRSWPVSCPRASNSSPSAN